MCKFSVIKTFKKWFRNRFQKTIQGTIFIATSQVVIYHIVYIEKTDNFNPNATHVYNTYNAQDQPNKESDTEPLE